MPSARTLAIRAASVTAFAIAMLAVGSAVGSRGGQPSNGDAQVRLAAKQADYRRPTSIPVPASNPLTPERVKLGERLFKEQRLSANDTVSCATCHDPALAFSDGVALGKGIAKEPLKRHTPSLWNLAWARTYFWDGRAATLESQARGPIEHVQEMGQPLPVGVAKLAQDAGYRAAFAEAFTNDPNVTDVNILKAIASYERTLVSPPTRFDNWILGDAGALTASELRGFETFTGKAGCSSCHSGWAFTDHAFHDIGLPGDDLGRGPVIGLSSKVIVPEVK